MLIENQAELEHEDLLDDENLDDSESDEETDEAEDQDTEGDEDAETEEDETEGDEEDEEDEKPTKSSPKAEKRIASLTARLKSFEEENSHLKEKLEYLTEEAEKKETKYEAKFPQPLTYDNRPMAQITESEFRKALKFINSQPDATAEQKEAWIELAWDQREQGLAVEQEKAAVTNQKAIVWNLEWEEINDSLTDANVGYPALKKYVSTIWDQISKDVKDDKFLERKLHRGGINAKYEYTMKTIKKLGLDKKLQTEFYSQQKPDLKVPVGKGKSKSTPISKSGPATFTDAQIEKMSLAEFLKNQSAINKAMATGKIKL